MPFTCCPICHKQYKDRLRIHLIEKHNIPDPAATEIKNLSIRFKWGYQEEKQEIAKKLKTKLAENGFRFEKLRGE